MSTLTLENGRAAVSAAATAARELKAHADRMRDAMAAEGVDLLAAANKDQFDKLDEAYKAADLKADEAEVLRGRLDRLSEMEGTSSQRLAAQREDGRLPYVGERSEGRMKSFAHRITDAPEFKAFQDQLRSVLASGGETMALQMAMAGIPKAINIMSRAEFRALMDFKATTVTGGGATSGGPFIINDLQPGFVPYARKRPSMAALVGQGETDSDVVEYVTQTAASTGAAETAEDTAAPESAITFLTNTTNVREITHFIPITLRAMADAGQLRSIVEGDLVAGVFDRVDTQVYAGGGTGQDLAGITITSGINTQPMGGDTRLDAIHKAITLIRIAPGVYSEPDAIAMNPTDWQNTRLDKDADGQYLLGPAGMAGDKQIWGIPVVSTPVVTAGQPLVGDFAGSSKLWTREGLSLNSGLDGNDFTKRRISLLVAIRLAFAVTRPTGFTVVTGY